VATRPQAKKDGAIFHKIATAKFLEYEKIHLMFYLHRKYTSFSQNKTFFTQKYYYLKGKTLLLRQSSPPLSLRHMAGIVPSAGPVSEPAIGLSVFKSSSAHTAALSISIRLKNRPIK